MTVITQLPDPPSRTTPSQFSSRTDAFLGALPGFVTETNAVASEAEANKVIAVDSAALAVQKAMAADASARSAAIANTATKWVDGTSYTIGQGVWSPVDYRAYRRKTTGAGTTDPSLDPTNWALVGYDEDHSLTIHADWPAGLTPTELGHVGDVTSPIQEQLNAHAAAISTKIENYTSTTYDNRASLRSMTPTDGLLAIVEGLGFFRWYSGSTELDDDETCFATATGRWLIEYPHVDMVYATFLGLTETDPQADLTTLEDRVAGVESSVNVVAAALPQVEILFGAVSCGITSVSATSQASFSCTVTGVTTADDCHVIVNPSPAPGSRLAFFGMVTGDNTVTIYINNPSAATQSITAGTWRVVALKEI